MRYIKNVTITTVVVVYMQNNVRILRLLYVNITVVNHGFISLKYDLLADVVNDKFT